MGKRTEEQWVLILFQKLYQFEKDIKGKPVDEIYNVRQEQAKLLRAGYKDWPDKPIHQVQPKSTISKAIVYSLN